MPILWGEELVGRIDARLDRGTQTLVVNGIWLEDPTTELEPEFVRALAAGIERLMNFLGAQRIDVAAVEDSRLREALTGIQPPAAG